MKLSQGGIMVTGTHLFEVSIQDLKVHFDLSSKVQFDLRTHSGLGWSNCVETFLGGIVFGRGPTTTEQIRDNSII